MNKNFIFILQEDERYKLRMKHLVEKEKLVLAVEQVIYFIILARDFYFADLRDFSAYFTHTPHFVPFESFVSYLILNAVIKIVCQMVLH